MRSELMREFKIGSLFDGSGGFPLAASLCGIEPTWASEVDPYPIAVTRSRFPNMKHLGSVTDINGGEIEPVDIIAFGSPCQDFSVAGKRAGLKHEANGDEETTRSGLLMEAVRIIREMREATNGRYPTFALWENVPGAFSSNKGEDFRTVLEELIKIVEPGAVMPTVPQKGWPYADCYCGDGWSIAYRVLDAQYIRTAQRRRRVYLVLDLRGERAGKVLFEREGLRGNFAESGSPWKATSRDVENCSGAANRAREETKCVTFGFPLGFRPENVRLHQETATTLCNGTRPGFTSGICTAQYLFENHSQDSRYRGPLDVRPMLPAQLGTGGNNQPFVVKSTPIRYFVRRLTPIECSRLQGFPDTWGHPDLKEVFTNEEYNFWLNVRNTHATINGKATKEYTKEQMLKWYNGLHTDSAEYKLWGNGIALPPALYCMQGMVEALEAEQ